ENIASTFQGTKVNRKTQTLLEESQRITIQMREQEEELRQNLEELQATQEEMQRTQREISEKEGNMRALLDNASDAILAFDHQYKVIVINQSMKRLYESMGVYLDLGRVLEDPYPGRTYEAMQKEFNKALSGERFTTYSEVMLKGEIHYYEILYNPMYNERQRVIGASLFITDVTQQKTIENSLKIKQANLDSLINNTEDSIVAADKHYRILVYNEVYKKRRKDFEVEEGSNILEFMPEHIRDEWKKYYDRTLEGERFDKVIKRKEGKRTTYRQYSFNPILDEKEDIIGFSVFSKDITESKLAEAENQKIIQNLFTKVRESQERILELEESLATKSS
ncbi:MAG: PAS domain-containing protein, partial [Bacteroidota bacterium]